jgi:hypothetical protein
MLTQPLMQDAAVEMCISVARLVLKESGQIGEGFGNLLAFDMKTRTVVDEDRAFRFISSGRIRDCSRSDNVCSGYDCD